MSSALRVNLSPKNLFQITRGFPHIFYDLDQRVIIHNRVFKKDLVETLYEMINSSYTDYQAEINQHMVLLEERDMLMDKQNNLIEGASDQV